MRPGMNIKCKICASLNLADIKAVELRVCAELECEAAILQFAYLSPVNPVFLQSQV